jgi:UDP-N-acetylmuramoylalanine--D-glutamate ligase
MKNSGRGEKMKENRMTLESYLESIRSKTVAVIGIGISNMPLLELLCHAGIAVTACDRKSRRNLGKQLRSCSRSVRHCSWGRITWSIWNRT